MSSYLINARQNQGLYYLLEVKPSFGSTSVCSLKHSEFQRMIISNAEGKFTTLHYDAANQVKLMIHRIFCFSLVAAALKRRRENSLTHTYTYIRHWDIYFFEIKFRYFSLHNHNEQQLTSNQSEANNWICFTYIYSFPCTNEENIHVSELEWMLQKMMVKWTEAFEKDVRWARCNHMRYPHFQYINKKV